MKKYKIKLIKKYSFVLDGENKKDIENQVNIILQENNILDLPYVRKSLKIKIKELREDRNIENIFKPCFRK